MKKPLLLSLLETGEMKVEQVAHCAATASEVPVVEGFVREKKWTNHRVEIALMNEVEAKKANMNFTVQQICFDPVSGLSFPKSKKVVVVVPVKDLAESRLDRASYVEIETASARISIN